MQSSDVPVLMEDDLGLAATLMDAYTCDYCGKLSLAWVDLPRNHSYELRPNCAPHFVDQVTESMAVNDKRLSWLPLGRMGKEYDDVPPHIASAASEAQRCLSVGAYRGAVSLARSVVEASAKEKGIASGSLIQKIDKMHSRGLIREIVRESAHEIRHLGNEMAHGDLADPVEEEEADETLGLMDEVLIEVFQSPARLERRRAARLVRKSEIKQKNS